ncbi:MAG TPA: hypothetical protein DEQ61_19265 [Streptomyces sp.]|nr:hypothetical protein [Streptomyces sp.]
MLREIRWSAVSAGQETLGDNLLHYCRRQSRMDVNTARQPEESAESIRQALDFEDTHPAMGQLSHEIPKRALRESSARGILTACVRYIEQGDWKAFVGTLGVPENRIEIRGWFPELVSFSESVLEPAEVEDVDGILVRYIGRCHPHCPWLLPQLVGEAARALARYPSESLMTKPSTKGFPWRP